MLRRHDGAAREHAREEERIARHEHAYEEIARVGIHDRHDLLHRAGDGVVCWELKRLLRFPCSASTVNVTCCPLRNRVASSSETFASKYSD